VGIVSAGPNVVTRATACGDDPSLLRSPQLVTCRSTADAKIRIGKRAVTASPSLTNMQVDSEHKHIPSRKPQKDLQPTDLDEKLTALRRRTAG
jgi:hypothetical protein